MSTTNYIRPMSFRETLRSMFKVYWKIFLPIVIMNLIITIPTLGLFIILGLFVGPILIMTSNVILGKPIRFWESLRRGIFSKALLKIGVAAIVFYIITVIFSALFYSIDENVGFGFISFFWYFLTPLWIFIPMIILLEKKGLRAATKRSFHILRSNFKRIIQMDILITLVFTLVPAILAPISGGGGIVDIPTYLYAGVVLAFITGLNSLPYVFVYYEYRARVENYNEELLSQELGYQPIEEMMTI